MVTRWEERGVAEFRHADPAMDQALEWFLRLQAGEGDRRLFDVWLAGRGEHRDAYDRVRKLWNCPELSVATAQLPQTPVVSKSRPSVVRIAQRVVIRFGAPLALAATVLGAAVLVEVSPDWVARWTADYQTAAGEIRDIALPDGSRMQLNSRSIVALDFEKDRRGVRLLEGEAWFEVAHDASRPFTVTAGHGTVLVTGTSFNVERLDEADVVVLRSGRISLGRRGDAEQALVLSPGDAAEVDADGVSRLSEAALEDRLAWRDGWVLLAGVPLREALSRIGRYSQARILALGGEALEIPVSGSFRIEEADAAIESVATAAGAKFERLPGGFIIIH